MDADVLAPAVGIAGRHCLSDSGICGPPAAVAAINPDPSSSLLLLSTPLLLLLATRLLKFSVKRCARCSRVLLYS
jgi:hypothetical protein